MYLLSMQSVSGRLTDDTARNLQFSSDQRSFSRGESSELGVDGFRARGSIDSFNHLRPSIGAVSASPEGEFGV